MAFETRAVEEAQDAPVDDVHLTLRVVLFEVGEHLVAVDASDLRGFEYATEDDAGRAVPVIELPAELASELPADASKRLRVQQDGREYDIRVASRVRIETVTLGQLHRLPDFLAGLRSAVGVLGLVEIEDRFAILLDARSIVGRWKATVGAG